MTNELFSIIGAFQYGIAIVAFYSFGLFGLGPLVRETSLNRCRGRLHSSLDRDRPAGVMVMCKVESRRWILHSRSLTLNGKTMQFRSLSERFEIALDAVESLNIRRFGHLATLVISSKTQRIEVSSGYLMDIIELICDAKKSATGTLLHTYYFPACSHSLNFVSHDSELLNH